MILRNGWTVNRYIYCDKSTAAQAVAVRRLHDLSARYPEQFPLQAWENAFHTIPQDVWSISAEHLQQAGCLDGTQWFVIGGFECQDLSPASGKGQGLHGSRSSTFFPLCDIIGYLQEVQTLPPLYLVENTSMQVFDRSTPAIKQSFHIICETLGSPVLLDSATAGSAAHRLRNYWSNMCHPHLVRTAFQFCRRSAFPSVQLADILGPNRVPSTCSRVNGLPWCQEANTVGERVKVLPTLMATINSRAFVPGRAGMVWAQDAITHSWHLSPLTLSEREMASGYHPGATAAPGLTFADRHSITGSCFDAHAVSLLMAVSLAIRLRGLEPSPGMPTAFALTSHGLGGGRG